MFRASDFKYKEVINIADGQCLGFVFDMELDEETGCVSPKPLILFKEFKVIKYMMYK